jgi:thiol-disulfide isomerase/thioredoxin
MRKLALSLAFLAMIAGPALAGEKYNNQITIGEKAPNFTGIPATDPKGTDATISLKDAKEDVVVLVFLANHCPVVVAYEDRIIDLAKSYEGKNVKFIGVCVNRMDQDRLPAIKEKVKEKGYNFVYGHDESQAVGKAYGAVVTPEFFVLDKNRVVRYAGALDDSQNESNVKKTFLKDAIDAVLAGETVEVAVSKARGCGISYGK